MSHASEQPKSRALLIGIAAALVVMALVYSLTARTGEVDPRVAADAESVSPLGVGDTLPSFTVYDVNGDAVAFDAETMAEPALIITFRGGWCPYCNLHLSELRNVVPEISEMGVNVVFFSGDRPEILYSSLMEETQDDIDGLDYTIYSDADADAAKALGIAFAIDGPVAGWQAWALSKGRDIEDSSIERVQALPVPAVYAVDTDGVIQYAFVEADYKKRLPADDVLAVAAELVQ